MELRNDQSPDFRPRAEQLVELEQAAGENRIHVFGDCAARAREFRKDTQSRKRWQTTAPILDRALIQSVATRDGARSPVHCTAIKMNGDLSQN